MKSCAFATAIVLLGVTPSIASASTVVFQEGLESGMRFMDVFLTPTRGTSFLNFDFLVTPSEGSLIDPVRNLPGRAGDFDAVTDGARLDTWANTQLSSFGIGVPSYVFREYHPGAPPSAPSDSVPTPGGMPDQLNWGVFDTNVDDDLTTTLHIARFLYTPGGKGTVSIRHFDELNSSTGGELFTSPYGISEPASGVLGGLGILGCVAVRRRPSRRAA